MTSAVVGGTLIDGNGGPPEPNVTILVEDGRIAAVRKSKAFNRKGRKRKPRKVGKDELFSANSADFLCDLCG